VETVIPFFRLWKQSDTILQVVETVLPFFRLWKHSDTILQVVEKQ
jgi:uncharacterized protein (DUF779 family)